MKSYKKVCKSQVSLEYIVVISFALVVVLGVLTIAFFYSGGIKDKIRTTQISNAANKILSTAESVYYSGEPSKATITIYFPDGINDFFIDPQSDEIVVVFSSSSGDNTASFTSNVPIIETPGDDDLVKITHTQGSKRVQVEAKGDNVVIGQV